MVKKLTEPLPRWKDGVCQTMSSEIFFMDADDKADSPSGDAQAACDRCTIVAACLHWAMINHEPYGVWGGTTPKQRQQLRRPIIRVHCPGCSSEAILEEPTSETCLSCGLSWRI